MAQRDFTDTDRTTIGLLAGQAFRPSSPIREKDIFAGRHDQIRQTIDAIGQPGQSVLIYGERGVGKTSLANVIDDIFLSVRQTRIFCPHVNCDADDSFTSLWLKVFGEKDRRKPTVDLSDTVLGEIDNVLEDAAGELTPHDIRSLCDIVNQTHLFLPIIDEFDRVDDDESIRLMTDTVKTLSDHTESTTVILVGVGDTIDDLIDRHESVERSLVQVPMPRMVKKEASQILSTSTGTTGITFSGEAMRLITLIAQGPPHYVHALGLHAVRSAVDSYRWEVSAEDVRSARDAAISSSGQSLVKLYTEAISSPRKDNLYRHVLLACVFAERDGLSYFAAADVKTPLSAIMGVEKRYAHFNQHLQAFCESDRGRILQRSGTPRRFRFRFRNPLIQPYVLMQGLSDGLIDEAQMEQLSVGAG